MDMMTSVADVLPRYSAYSQLLPFHVPLQDALKQAHIQMIIFFTRAKSIFTQSSVRMLLKLTKKSLEKEFEDCIYQMRRYRDLVEAESKVASIRLQLQESERAEEERRHAEDSRRQVQRLEAIADERRKEEARIWLNARKCAEEKTLVQESRLDGTCEWILRRLEVTEWVGCEGNQVLWIHGVPGSGKSYLYIRLLELLEEKQPAIYFLFCGGDKERVNLSSLLRSWCLQLLDLFPQLDQHLRTVRNKYDNRVASDKEITELFHLLLEHSPTVYLTVDALDECLDRDKFLKLIRSIPIRFKVLITSRTPCNLYRDLASIQRPLQTLEMKPELSEADLHRYIVTKVDNASLPYGNETLEKIQRRLLDCDGMFLWVKLMIEHLQTQTCEFEILQSLQELPEGLPQTYERILESINLLPSPRRLLAYKVFFWGLTVRRPVSATELRCLLAIQPSSDSFDDTRVIPEVHSAIPSVCGGLIQLRGKSQVLYFTHFTVTEYLQEHLAQADVLQQILACYESQELISNDSLASAICLRYLCYEFVGALHTPQDHREVKTLISDPNPRLSLLSYATSHWFDHVARTDRLDPLVEQLALRFLDRTRPNLTVWWHAYWFFGPDSEQSVVCPQNFSSLHVAAYLGLSPLVAALLPRSGPSLLDSSARSPLWWAASRGHAEVAAALMKAGFDFAELDRDSIAPIHRAAANGHVEVLAHMKASARPDNLFVTDSEGWTAFHWAASRGELSTVRKLTDYCAPPGSQYDWNHTKLAIISKRCNSGRTALHIAALNGFYALIQCLSLYSDIQAQDDRGYTALHLAAIQGHARVVETLLSYGADQTILDESGKTAAERAKDMGHENIFNLLTVVGRCNRSQASADIELRQRVLDTGKRLLECEMAPLPRSNLASREQDYIDKGVNFRDTQDAVVLRSAVNGHRSQLMLMLRKSRDLYWVDARCRTALHHAAALGYERIVRDVLRYIKGSVNRPDDRGWTPLHYAAAGRFPPICKLLLASEALAHLCNKESLTAYDLAFAEGHRDTIEAIVRYGQFSSACIASDFGWEAVHIGARDGTLTAQDIETHTTKTLVAVDRFGRSPLYRAVEMRQRQVVDCLLQRIELSSPDLLELAITAEQEQGNEDMVHLILSYLKPLSISELPGEQGLGQYLLSRRMKENDASAVSMLCDAGVGLINCRDHSKSKSRKGVHAIILALQYQAWAVAETLIRRGIDVNPSYPDSSMMLYMACKRCKLSVIGALLEHGVDPSKPVFLDENEYPYRSAAHNNVVTSPLSAVVDPYQYMPQEQRLAAARLLLDRDSSLLTGFPTRYCPAWKLILIHTKWSVDLSPFSAVEELFEEYGYAHLAEFPDEQGFVSLHRAVVDDDAGRLKDILDSGVMVEWCTFLEEKTPLQLAVVHNSFDSARLLVERGADVSVLESDEAFHGSRYGVKVVEHREEIVRRLRDLKLM